MSHPTTADWLRSGDRRGFLQAAGTFAFLPLIAAPAVGAVRRHASFSTDPFQLGVASGDPSHDGFVLWTRLAPDPVNGGGMPPEHIEVRWEIAHDEQMQQLVQQGRTTAGPELGHSVHVEVEGLEADRWYFYRFVAGDAVSPVGRARTMPAADASVSQLNFAFASCQHYESGYYNAYRHMVEDDLDLIVHLGDYIYEGGITNRDRFPRRHNSNEIVSLDDYRNRYALYKTDPDLQRAHALCPWLVTWDDHEFDNNYANDISEELNVPAASFMLRRADAYQAYYEHMPLRRSSIPDGPFMQLYRTVTFGQLAEFDVLDTRQYRTDQPCGDRSGPPCDAVFDDRATLLGNRQEQWLKHTLRQSGATWNILAQQVMMGRVDRDPETGVRWSMDQWSGYDVARRRLIEFLGRAEISNPIVLTGDIHCNFVNDLKVDFDDEQGAVLATEFVGTSVSSGGNGEASRPGTKGVLADNPFVRFYNGERGFVRCLVTPDRWQADYRVVDTVTSRESTCLTRASFTVESNQPGAQVS